ncbi:unnamed protein product [Acanthoscelides obtectus]|uniref:Uncharacterized protein n=1 Tax=Acanthoscelides obtectus TaxID=200917 RepID=A0A9P0JSP8_ACAOB|nr:unnamed protein product [Acanthoscelides obtectus]CAK1663752.1 hypothetical protein AOBTE_LOCUS23838 [Acanthoscelides obtectus]
MSGKGQGKTRPQEKRLMVYFREYCDYTGIHGFRYIGEDRTLAERKQENTTVDSNGMRGILLTSLNRNRQLGATISTSERVEM